jgi:hypothetical protein
MKKNNPKRLLILYSANRKTRKLSYVYEYPEAFKSSEYFDVTLANYGKGSIRRWIDRLRVGLSRKTFDAIVMLHTVSESSHGYWAETFDKLGAPVVWFIGNEHRGQPSKMDFAKHAKVSMLVSQSISTDVHKVYSQHLDIPVIGMPVVCYNSDYFFPGPELNERPIDLGYRAFPGPAWLGHWQREDIAQTFLEHAQDQLKLDISLRTEDRFSRQQWRHFLQMCKAQLCVPAGGDFFELTDETRLKVEAYLKKNPKAERKQLEELFPDPANAPPLRVMNSRLLEAAATRTPQVMYKMNFEAPLIPDEDYIGLNLDHSNIDDVIRQLQDHSRLKVIAENCSKKLSKFANYKKYMAHFNNALEENL